MREIIKKHIEANDGEIDRIEGLGALNFLAIDDLIIAEEGETLDPMSLLELPFEEGRPVFPTYKQVAEDPFLRKVETLMIPELWTEFHIDRHVIDKFMQYFAKKSVIQAPSIVLQKIDMERIVNIIK